MKKLLGYLSVIIVVFALSGASCEPPTAIDHGCDSMQMWHDLAKESQALAKEYNVSLQKSIELGERLGIVVQVLADSVNRLDVLLTSSRLQVTRQQDSLNELFALLQAMEDLKEAYKARLDSAVVIIARQSKQLANSTYGKP